MGQRSIFEILNNAMENMSLRLGDANIWTSPVLFKCR